MDSLVNAIVLIVVGLGFGVVVSRLFKESNETEQVKKRVERIRQIREQLQADKQTSAQKVSEYEQAKADYLSRRGDK